MYSDILVCLAYFNFYSVMAGSTCYPGQGATIWLSPLVHQARVQLYGWFHLVARPGVYWCALHTSIFTVCNYMAGSACYPGQGATIWLSPLVHRPGCNYMTGSTWSPGQGATMWLALLGCQARVQLYDWFHLVTKPGCNYVAGYTCFPGQGATMWLAPLTLQARVQHYGWLHLLYGWLHLVARPGCTIKSVCIVTFWCALHTSIFTV